MSFPVVEGSNRAAFDREMVRQELLMRLGVAGRTIYLNGGSETRRDIREFWRGYAKSRNIGFQTWGGCVVIVGGDPKRKIETNNRGAAVDLRQFAKTNFYAGPPTSATENKLIWDGQEYSMVVYTEGDAIVAMMHSGNMEWRTYISLGDIKGQINACLEDACDLGRIANYSRDPER